MTIIKRPWLLVVLAAWPAAGAIAQPTSIASVNNLHVQGNDDSFAPSLSGDGRLVVFASDATNLSVDDFNKEPDVFLRDRFAARTIKLSVDPTGGLANGASSAATISRNGRVAAFSSLADNLVGGDHNGVADVFVRYLESGVTVRASVSTEGVEADGPSDSRIALSADGRYVAFESAASNLVAGDRNGVRDVFVRDLALGVTVRVSVDSSGAEGDAISRSPALSDDGRLVAFASDARNLVPGDSNVCTDVFVHDLRSGATTRVSVNADGEQGSRASGASFPSLSADGRLVAFDSYATNLVPDDGNGSYDVFVKDRITGKIVRASVSSLGVEGNDNSLQPALSGDGRLVAYTSFASTLVPHDTNGTLDVFVHEIATGRTDRVSVDWRGRQAAGFSQMPAVSRDGRQIAFESSASGLAPDEDPTIFHRDIYVRDAIARTELFAWLRFP